VFFYNTKNGRDHRLPITPMALNLLRQRQKLAAEEVARRGFDARSRPFVFPAHSKFSSTGHYKDATDLLSRIRDEAEIVRVTRHDLRRSFGSVMRGLGVDEGIKKRFFNHASTDVTATYTEAEWALLRSEMERIEQAILVTAPNVYNALKPPTWPPLAAPDPHECKPAKPRSGRPRKEAGPEADKA
jgi:integrase